MTTRRPPDPRRSGAPSTITDPLREALRSLPRATADASFTRRVLAHLDETPDGARRERLGVGVSIAWMAGGLATAALVLAVGVTVLGPLFRDPVRPEPTAPTASGDGGAAAVQVADVPSSSPSSSSPSPAGPAPEPADVAGAGLGAPAQRPSSPPPSPSPGPAAVSVVPPAAEVPPDAAAARRRALLAEVRSELEALRRDHRRLTAGLADLPEIGADGRPVLYVGGDEGLGLVLGAREEGPGARPVSTPRAPVPPPGGGASI